MNPLRQLGRSFRFAGQGVAWAWRHQRNLRIELAVAVLVLLLTLLLRRDPTPILLISALVIALELINTAIEALVDIASPAQNPLAKRAKDVAAAAVLLAALIAVVIGLVELGPPLFALLRGAP